MAEYTEASSEGTPIVAKNDKELLTECHERLKKCIDDHESQRKQQRDDLLFCTLEQWPSDIRQSRENDPNGARPCLTIDQINQYVVQVTNDMRQNRPAVKVRPVDDIADPETAEVLQGMVRQIEDQSIAQIAYMTAGESAVKIGEGYFRFVTEYENDQSFDQVIRVKRIADTFSVYLGPHVMPTGEDAEYGFVFQDVPEQQFRRMWPEAKYQATDFEGLDSHWYADRRIKVAEYLYFDYQGETLVFLADGKTMTMSQYNELEEKPEIKDQRPTKVRKLKWCKLTGAEILEKRDLPTKYLGIVKVTGKEAWVDGKRVIWGLVRPAKDSLRMYNYWASTITEKIALSPKTPFIIEEGQVEGHEAEWQQANVKNYSHLKYKAKSVDGTIIPPPQRQPATPVEVAMIQQMQIIREDVKASLGMYKASLGQEQPNQSGKAILALVRESDTGTFHFQDNMSLSIAYGGRIMIDMIPHYYDARRVVKVLGEDGTMKTAELDPDQPKAKMRVEDEQTRKVMTIYNPNIGIYDVTATTGPSYNTKRMEAATLFTDLAQSAKDPITAGIVTYLAMKNSDINGADKAADMMGRALPPGILPQEGEEKIPPAVMQQMTQMKQAGDALAQENQELKSGVVETQMKVQAQHDAKMKELELKKVENDREHALAMEKMDRELDMKERIAEKEIDLMERKCEAELRLEDKKISAKKEIDQQKIASDREVKLESAAIDGAAQTQAASQPVVNVVDSAAAGPLDNLAKSMESVAEAVKATAEKDDKKEDGEKVIRLIRENGQLVGARVTAG